MSEARSPAGLAGRRPRSASEVRRLLARPSEPVEATRWLFWLLALFSLLASIPASTLRSTGTLSLLAVVSVLALGLSLTVGYLSRRGQGAFDVLDAAMVLLLACASPSPAIAFPTVFGLIWFRSLYGSTRGALIRVGSYGAALLACLPLWPYLPGHDGPAATAMILGILPTMAVTLVAGRHLGRIARDRQEASRRDTIHAATGSRLLGVIDQSEIARIAWDAVGELCEATPGLQVLKVVDAGTHLRVTQHSSACGDVPERLPSEVITVLSHPDAASSGVAGLSNLDEALHCVCTWHCLALPNSRGQGWLVIGTPNRRSTQVVDTLRSLVNQVTLALRNSDAHLELTVQATRDSLTGLANRAVFSTSVVSVLAGPAAADAAVLFVDLDDFKDVNDEFGHTSGDLLLVEAATRLQRAARPGDLCARLGGDEFAVLLTGVGETEAMDVGRAIVAAMSAPMYLTGAVAHVGVSIGVALTDDDMTVEQVIRRADVAMYAAKAAGKGRVQLFTPGLLQSDSRQLAFDRQLLAATRNDELVVHYQPVVSLRDGQCTAAEALVRWQHPERGLLLPVEFIAQAERTGAIRDIGMFVLRQACADAAQWQLTRPAIAVQVNVSALQLDDAAFFPSVLRCLDEFSIPPHDLVLEITESVLLSSPAAIDQVTRLAEHGVAIAIDDFGTGYSALTTLRSLPVTIVKIDASFVAGSTVNPEDRAVTEAVVQMATRMGLQTIAEGVERPDQQDFLESIGADAAQGFLYLRPTTSAEFSTWRAGLLPAPSVAADDVVLAFPSHRAASGRRPAAS